MSEQTVETAIETEFKPNADGNLEPQSMEDKFFGVKTEIPTNKDSEELKVEVVDDVPEEDRRPPKQEVQEEQSVDDDALDKEIADYSNVLVIGLIKLSMNITKNVEQKNRL